jgi:hypothetical protein
MAQRDAGFWWQGQQYNEQLGGPVPDGLATNYWYGVADAANHPGLAGWGQDAFYGDANTVQLSARAGYTLPDPNRIDLGG